MSTVDDGAAEQEFMCDDAHEAGVYQDVRRNGVETPTTMSALSIYVQAETEAETLVGRRPASAVTLPG